MIKVIFIELLVLVNHLYFIKLSRAIFKRSKIKHLETSIVVSLFVCNVLTISAIQ